MSVRGTVASAPGSLCKWPSHSFPMCAPTVEPQRSSRVYGVAIILQTWSVGCGPRRAGECLVEPPGRIQARDPIGDLIQPGEILTRDRVLRAALTMIDADGVDALSMRKLGHALGRDPMGVYRHTKSKAALLDAVAELVLEGLQVPASSGADWESAIRAAAHSFRATALAHPRMILLLIERPMTIPPGWLRPSGLRWLEGLLSILKDAGFDDEGALHAYRFFTAFLSGHVLHEVQELTDRDAGSKMDIRTGFDLLPEKQFPRLRALAPGLAAHNGPLEFVLGLDIVLMGLRTRLLAATDNDHLTK